MVRFMHALVARQYGEPDVLALEEIPIPEPGPGQIQVRIAAAALNPADLRLLSGVLRGSAPLTFPHVPGSDFAGTVTVTGPGVTRFAPGDKVFGLGLPRPTAAMAEIVCTPPSLTTGTMAEYAVFDADAPAIAPRPAHLDPVAAAAIPMAGLTALPLLRALKAEPGDPVLVIGAAGGVGTAAVPLMAAAKTHVIGTARPEDEEFVRDLGAAEVIGYRDVDTVAETLRRHPGGVAALVNLAMPGDRLTEAARVVRPGGQVLNIAYPQPDPAVIETVFTAARPGDLADLATRLPLVPARQYPLQEAVRAYADLAGTHVRGKLVVTV